MTYSENQTDKQDAVEVKNYTRTPNMLIFGYQNISPQEKWLYVCLKHMCGKKGTRHLSLRYISEQTGISTGALSSSKNAKGVVNLGMMRHLHDSGLIHSEIKKHDGKGNPQYHVTITDVWALNQDFFQTRSEFGQDTEENANPSERLTSPSEIRTDTPSTRPNFGQTCPNSGTNIRLDNKTTITDKTTEQKENVAALADDASRSFPSQQNENDSQISTGTDQFPTIPVENPPTSLQEADSSTPSGTATIVPEKPENTPIAVKSDDSTPTPENSAEVAKLQAGGKIRIAATSKPARNTRKPEKSAEEPKPAKPAEAKKNAHHPDLGKWYGMFNETCRALGKAEGIPANFTIPSRAQYTEAFESLIEAGVTLEQGKWVLTSIWKDPDPFWKKRRTPTAMASQYAVRISRMPRNLHIVPTPEPATCESVDPEKPVERWTRILDQNDVLDLSLEDRKDYFIWKNAQRKVS